MHAPLSESARRPTPTTRRRRCLPESARYLKPGRPKRRAHQRAQAGSAIAAAPRVKGSHREQRHSWPAHDQAGRGVHQRKIYRSNRSIRLRISPAWDMPVEVRDSGSLGDIGPELSIKTLCTSRGDDLAIKIRAPATPVKSCNGRYGQPCAWEKVQRVFLGSLWYI